MRPTHRLAALWLGAGLLAAAVVLVPIVNPDLFWHLSSGRWILGHRAWPREDFLSFTAAGRPWVDFEWLSQLAFFAIHSATGLPGLWLFKAAILAVPAVLLERTLAWRGCGPELRAAGLALWAAGLLAGSDIRPELFSLVFLSALIHAGESGRLRRPSPRLLAGVLVLFSLWANLHGGFPVGWLLLSCYALTGGSWLALLAAVAATALNPYGLGPWQVLLLHSAQGGELSRVIGEWRSLDFHNPTYWPVWGLLAATLLACAAAALVSVRSRWARQPPWPLLLAALALGLATLRHERACVYFALCAAALLPLLAHDLGWEDQPWPRRISAGVIAVGLAFLIWLSPRMLWTAGFNYKFVPRAAVEFMAEQREVLQPLRLYNQWEWGGYLGWRLAPWYRVFWDGRYIFQKDLASASRQITGPGPWQAFLAARKVDGALMPNLAQLEPAQRLYPDGTVRDFPRPWYVFFLPKERWALVYWDSKALLFLDRASLPASWLAEHEYRFLRPHDEPALQEALQLKEVPLPALAAERARHERELARYDGLRRP